MFEDPKFIGACVGLVLALTALVKVYTEVLKIKADRKNTAEVRDADSQQIHDMILKHDFAITALKDAQALTATVVDDLRDQCSALNANIVKLDTNVSNLTEAIKELKQ